jgi:hypothetical protein
VGINRCGRGKHSDCSLFWPRLSRGGKNQWYIVSQLILEQTIWQPWWLVFLPTKLSVLLKIIFCISLKTTNITSKIQISEVCDLYITLVMWHTVSWICFSYQSFFYRSDDKFRPHILSVCTTAHAGLRSSK